jgi:hypothetical protein
MKKMVNYQEAFLFYMKKDIFESFLIGWNIFWA